MLGLGALVIGALPLWLFSCYMSGSASEKKGLSENRWLVAGLLFSPFALLALAGQPDLKQQHFLRLLVEANGFIESDERQIRQKTYAVDAFLAQPKMDPDSES
jgi:hypothetical protein